MPALKPEAAARENIDAALVASGWVVQDKHQTNLKAGLGVAIREFKGKAGHGFADYLLYVDGKAIGAVEAKAEGATLSGVEPQSARYSQGLPNNLPAWRQPLPFLYESTGVETRFTNLLDPLPRGRRVFSFHRPEFLRAQFVTAQHASHQFLAAAEPPAVFSLPTLRTRLRNMPPLVSKGLWEVQAQAVANLEESLADNRPRSLVVMATGSGKTVTAVTAIYRLVKHADASKVLFLVDRSNLGRQALREFQNYVTPDDGRKFTELYNVQLLTSNNVDPVANVVITTIQRLYSILQGQPELDPELEEGSQFETGAGLVKEPVPVAYNPAFPIEQFDFIFTDECHRSIYNLWRQVLEYFDAYLVGLTATPSKQTLGFFHQNLVMDYNHEQAVADGINVDFDVYRINTQITQSGSTVEAGWHVTKRDRLTRKQRSELMDQDFVYPASALDRDVVARDQIRTVVRTFKARLFTDIFPGREAVPKTLVYAKDDAHAEDIVEVLREEFAQGNDFAQKITYRTTGEKPEVLLQKFRNAYYPRIVVTVDMIATGTDVKPIEIVMFMRAVKSRTFFEQMKGRGVRVINPTDLRAVTADAVNKDHFVIVDCVGLCE
ncbi:MAG TPA: DEAD/DEAH box helicase family protein, partial [Chloroflexota bacterium]|nr:DEAD/DEAH box helicase family protein [Chloroflexota bacterium]